MKTIPATKVKNSFGECLAQVTLGRDPLIVERHGRPIAVLVSYPVWQEVTGEQPVYRSAWVEMALELSEKIRRRGRPQTPAVELIRQIRDENG
ncbi:MAG: type II toxin-antitoxin system Phd/YefM family antitoxin [Deltaproteobacteria bacterium]|nr:type II toxin-antitoxin system Phd/YefM family antitoxin [Deltaproteobacteria bacterium]